MDEITISPEEQILNDIRNAEDYQSELVYHDASWNNVINYMDDWSVSVGSKATQTYNYELVEGGYALKSTTLTITQL